MSNPNDNKRAMLVQPGEGEAVWFLHGRMQNSPDVENLEIEVDLLVPGQQRGELEAPLTVRGNVRWAGGVHEVSRLPRPLRIGRLDKSGRHDGRPLAGGRAATTSISINQASSQWSVTSTVSAGRRSPSTSFRTLRFCSR